MSELNEDAFGLTDFKKAAREKLREIKPSSPPPLVEDPAEVDAIAARRGFISRDPSPEVPEVSETRPTLVQAPSPSAPAVPPTEIRAALPVKEPFEQVSFRMPYSKKNLFQEWCTSNRFTYSEGVLWLMEKAGVLK